MLVIVFWDSGFCGLVSVCLGRENLYDYYIERWIEKGVWAGDVCA